MSWIYADRLEADPQPRHKVKDRTGFAFSNVYRIIAGTINRNFKKACLKPDKFTQNPVVALLARMAAWFMFRKRRFRQNPGKYGIFRDNLRGIA